MRRFIGTTLAVIMTAIFTFAFGISDANAKTVVFGSVGTSFSPNGTLNELGLDDALMGAKFNGPTYGAGIWFNEGKRISFRVSYMSQKSSVAPFHWCVVDGESIIATANFLGDDISSLNINPNEEYASVTATETVRSGLMTGSFGISILPGKTVEPIIWGVGGLDIRKQKIEDRNYYNPKLDAVTDFYRSKGFEGEYFRFEDGDGSVSNVTSYEPVYGVGFSLNIHLGERFILMPEFTYLQNFGASARISSGVRF